MEYHNTYNYEKQIIPFGYTYNESEETVKLSEIVSSVVDNIIIYDTENIVLDVFLAKAQRLLNNKDKLVIGLVSNKDIKSLSSKGIQNGFFRSTPEASKVAIIIVDKSKIYFALDKDYIFETNDAKKVDIYNYVNHLIWSKSDFEFCQGNLAEVKSTRLSIVKPSFKENTIEKNLSYSTKNLGCLNLLKKKEDNQEYESLVLHNCTDKAYVLNDDLYLNAIENQYYSISNWESLIKAKSFSNEELKKLSKNQLWIDGALVNVKKKDSIARVFTKPLDEYKTFTPDFDAIANEYKEYTLSLDVHVTVNPIVLDEQYKLSGSYQQVDTLQKKLTKNLEELKKLVDDKDAKKQLTNIESERNIFEKARLYNLFIENKDFGVEALNTKTKFKKVNYDLSWVVPSDILGKLYTKGKDVYMALNDESKVEEAKKWLDENHIEAVLILGKED